ncbi:hypothetical protein [Zobellia alginiliquefaciens]|uniref:hypothetical protein n=1 Tax=Zobellia alginiliquefaciens TaxID=3032586 RepID=UPI0023E3A434|nr:hypothetical protein [Zobellia alginiliquefaciens]
MNKNPSFCHTKLFWLFLSFLTLSWGYAQNDKLKSLEIPKTPPLGYESILTAELNDALMPGAAYEVGFWIFGKQLQDESYSYPITVFPSNGGDISNEGISDIVESVQPSPKLEVNPPPNYATRGHFTFIVRPDKPYDYLTIALKNTDTKASPINFKKDIKVIGVFSKPLPNRAMEKVVPPKDAGTIIPDTPVKIAERTLIDSFERYSVSEKNVQLGLYDHRRIDNDIVTVYLNGKIAVEQVALKRKKQFFKLNLQPGENIITLHAENLGDVAPNTSAILIKTKTEEFMAVLESDLGQSSYFTLIYEK